MSVILLEECGDLPKDALEADAADLVVGLLPRDAHGIRPLVLGRLDDGEWVVASETCAFDIVGATYVRDVAPGEIIRISDDGLISEQGMPASSRHDCIFEHVYFSRPDSVKDGSSFYLMPRPSMPSSG